MHIRLSVMVLATLCLAACGHQADEKAPARPAYLGEWRASANVKATITFAPDGNWSASDGCNRMGENFVGDGEAFDAPTTPNTTRRYCSNQVDYQRIVPEVARIQVDGDTATMYSGDGDVLLELVRVKSV